MTLHCKMDKNPWLERSEEQFLFGTHLMRQCVRYLPLRCYVKPSVVRNIHNEKFDENIRALGCL